MDDIESCLTFLKNANSESSWPEVVKNWQKTYQPRNGPDAEDTEELWQFKVYSILNENKGSELVCIYSMFFPH